MFVGAFWETELLVCCDMTPIFKSNRWRCDALIANRKRDCSAFNINTNNSSAVDQLRNNIFSTDLAHYKQVHWNIQRPSRTCPMSSSMTRCDPNIRDNRGRTGLHLAAARGNVEICRFLHKFGADLLATDYQGNTALHLCGHVDTIQFLVSNGLKIDICNHNGSTPLVLAKRRGVNKDAIRLLEGLEEQEVKGFNRGTHSKLETMQMAESESAMESHSLLNPNLQNSEGVLSSFRSTWQEFVEDLGFWRVLLLLVIIALLSLGIAYYVSGVLPFSDSQLELVH
ncbi:hypothetical protein AMELA_G00062620 [Ameiurus melas]|uniref:Ankyrin repeat domain-containing protein 46 n=1 Tax=Ameiurus melas TaxID=219545 RepID=A0A7J6B5V3_AMEME|nr:hypothetical protein AMELA_G00062620 [Ameiurus melas]